MAAKYDPKDARSQFDETYITTGAAHRKGSANVPNTHFIAAQQHHAKVSDEHQDAQHAFHTACERGDIDIVRKVLALTDDLAVNVHANDEAAFRVACAHGHLQVVRELLGLSGDRAVNVHAGHDAAFRSSCKNGHVAVVRELLSLTGERAVNVHSDEGVAFVLACVSGKVEVVRELLALTDERAVDTHAHQEGGFTAACANGHVLIVRELLSLTGDRAVDVHIHNQHALVKACENGHVDVVRELLGLSGDRAAHVHSRYHVAFRGACHNGHLGVVRELLSLTGDQAVDVHARGEQAFRMACKRGHLPVVRELLGLTGSRAVNVRANDEEALLDACAAEHLSVVRELLCMGTPPADVEPLTRSAPLADWLRNGGPYSPEEGRLDPDARSEAEARAGGSVCSCGSALSQKRTAIPWSPATLQRCLMKCLFRRPSMSRLLLQHMRLPAAWLLAAFPEPGRHPRVARATQPPTSLTQRAVVQQAVLAALRRCVDIEDLDRGGKDACATALTLCLALPGQAFHLTRQAIANMPHYATLQSGAMISVSGCLLMVVGDLAWRGVAVPLTPAPGVDIARAQPGALSRPGRRSMVLRRARQQAHIADV